MHPAPCGPLLVTPCRSGCWGRARSLATAKPRRRWVLTLACSSAGLPRPAHKQPAPASGSGCKEEDGGRGPFRPQSGHPLVCVPSAGRATLQPRCLPDVPAEWRAVPHAGQRGALPVLPVPRPGRPSAACCACRLYVWAVHAWVAAVSHTHEQPRGAAIVTKACWHPAFRSAFAAHCSRPPRGQYRGTTPRPWPCSCASPLLQSEYNRMKPTARNEFQTSNLKTAFRPGMQRGGAAPCPTVLPVLLRSDCTPNHASREGELPQRGTLQGGQDLA